MTKPLHRRAALLGAAAMPALAGAAAATGAAGADARLIAMCDAARALRESYQAELARCDDLGLFDADREAEHPRVLRAYAMADRSCALTDAAAAIPAATLAGVAAKARLLLAAGSFDEKRILVSTEDCLPWSICADLARGVAA